MASDYDPEVPHIQAECSDCYGGVARNALRQRLDAWATDEELRKHFGRPSFRVANFWNDTTEGDKMDVAELYRMYALEDTRTDQGGIPCK